jgi:hypothetical protein
MATFYKVQSKGPAECGVFYKLIEGEIEGITHHSRVKDV